MTEGQWMPLPSDGRSAEAAEKLAATGDYEVERDDEGKPIRFRAINWDAHLDRYAKISEHADEAKLDLARRRAEWVAGGFVGPDPDEER
jgi:hypothetical protein